MSKIYLPCEIVQEYINFFKKIFQKFKKDESKESFTKKLSEISSVFLFGYQMGKEFCIAEAMKSEKNFVSKSSNNEANKCIGIFGKLYLETYKKFKESDKSVQGFLLKEIKFGAHHCCLIIELQNLHENHGLVILYNKKQFENSVLLNIQKENFFNAVDFVGNSLKIINNCSVQQNSRKNFPKDSNYIFTQCNLLTSKIIFTFFFLVSIIKQIL